MEIKIKITDGELVQTMEIAGDQLQIVEWYKGSKKLLRDGYYDVLPEHADVNNVLNLARAAIKAASMSAYIRDIHLLMAEAKQNEDQD